MEIGKELRIKTGCVKRLYKEHKNYCAEVAKQKVLLEQATALGDETAIGKRK
jgi:hypothetical protein